VDSYIEKNYTQVRHILVKYRKHDIKIIYLNGDMYLLLISKKNLLKRKQQCLAREELEIFASR
jgi:hypothetical protein